LGDYLRNRLPRRKSISAKKSVSVALAELLEQRSLSEGRYLANVVDGKVALYGR